MLHSRYVSKIPRALPQPTSPGGDNGSEVVVDSHDICSTAAASTVDMMRLLDKHGLMEQLSSDIIHILSLVTLFLGKFLFTPSRLTYLPAVNAIARCFCRERIR
jgi:hypothetical protein